MGLPPPFSVFRRLRAPGERKRAIGFSWQRGEVHFRSSVIVALTVVLGSGTEAAPQAEPLRQVMTIPLPDVPGRIDHLAVDLEGKRVFLAALEKNTVEVVDVASGRLVQTLGGFQKPQGLLYLASLHRLFVASGKDGTVKAFDGASLKPSVSATVSLGADALGYDPKANEIYVGSGGSDAGKERGDLTIFDARTLRTKAALTADAHAGGSIPDASGKRMFVLVPEKSEVMVVDRPTHTIKLTWTIPGIQKDVAIALDEKAHRLFLGVRTPPSILVLNSDTGEKVAEVATAATLDGLSFDASTRRIYTTGGEGFLDVTQQADANHYRQIARIATGPVARTSLFVPQWRKLFVAVPRDKDRPAELRVFEIVP
jgi:DNA-binding beta-propeller fold protein YncE